jgi:lectin, mannose-binding 1
MYLRVILTTTLAINLILSINAFVPPEITRRFEYKLSFKGPHLVFKDGTIPFWTHSGSTIPSNDQIRITPSIRSQKGSIWTNHKMNSTNWEIEALLKVNGRGRLGADGMAIWFTEEKGTEVPVFGSNDFWKGLGVFLDSFDNDMQQNNPYILIMYNDGTQSYDHNKDGINQQLGGCLRDFRNKPFPVRIKLEYYNKVLTVYYHSGLNNDASSYEICTRAENVNLPASGHFGVSAATGGLADDHDVISFLTYSLIDQTQQASTLNTNEEEKYNKEYQDFMAQLEQEKEKYKKEHPEKLDQQDIDERKNVHFILIKQFLLAQLLNLIFFYSFQKYELESDRQYRIILDVQNTIQNLLRLLDAKVAEILGRQERLVSMLSNQQPGSGQIQMIDNIKREEVNLILQQQADLVRSVKDLQNSVIDVQRRTISLENSRQLSSNADQAALKQIQDGLANLRFDVINSKQNQIQCPQSTSCLSTFYYIAFLLLQTSLFFIYMIYKSRAEAQAKKFY